MHGPLNARNTVHLDIVDIYCTFQHSTSTSTVPVPSAALPVIRVHNLLSSRIRRRRRTTLIMGPAKVIKFGKKEVYLWVSQRLTISRF
jgi:hypothetical protein